MSTRQGYKRLKLTVVHYRSSITEGPLCGTEIFNKMTRWLPAGIHLTSRERYCPLCKSRLPKGFRG